MTVLPWPKDSKGRPEKRWAPPIPDTLPKGVLHSMVANIPGPRNETAADRANRFQVQLAEVLSYGPRNAAEAMLAMHCVMMTVVAEESYRDAASQPASSPLQKKHLRLAKQLSGQSTAIHKLLVDRQSRPLGEASKALEAAVMALYPAPPEPDDAAQPELAESAVIALLHPAPKMLQ
jgi:hypothetical protein